MDRNSAILLGLTLVTLGMGYIRDGGGVPVHSAKARLFLFRAYWQAGRAARGSARGDMRAASHFERAVTLLQRAADAAEANLDADRRLEAINALLQMTADAQRQQAEGTIQKADALRAETIRAVRRLESMRPDTGEFDDTGHATA